MSRHKHKTEEANKIGHRTRATTRLRNYFLTGLVIAGPIGITLWLTWTFIKWVDGWVKPFVPKLYNPDTYLPFPIPGFGLIVAVFVLTMVGFLAANFLGRSFISVGEKIVGRMPLVRNIYSGLKQIFETVLDERGSSFTTAALIEYPRRGLWAIVFISTDTKGEVERRLKDKADTLSVFLPTTPNPTSGFLLFVPKEDIIELDMSVEDAAKLVISAGLVNPKYPEILADEIVDPVQLERVRTSEDA
ncbi:putative membrane protein [Labrenzia sp. MBR-25]